MAFNRESDVDQENANDVYYRYSVDEWQNYVHDGFDATNSRLQVSFDQFKKLHKSDSDSYQLDDDEIAYVAKINNAILDALKKLKTNGTFDDNTYLIIWYSDADYEIMNESARTLNRLEIFEKYASEFA